MPIKGTIIGITEVDGKQVMEFDGSLALEVQALNTGVQDLEDTKAPWIDVVQLKVDKLVKDQLVLNDIPTDIRDLKDQKASALVGSIATDDAIDLETALALVNELKAIINSMINFS